MPRFGTVRLNALFGLLVAACAFLAAQRSLAATKEPPYEAIVESDEAFFRCGPGKNFYPTGALQRGDRVTVRRHDPGGWFMIDPPAGSYSLIPADAVQREGNLGTIKPLAEGQTPVRIGSALDPTIDSVYQRQLSTGERVEILGEATRTHRGVPVLMLKIRSPRGEYRWIEGMNLIPVDQHIAQQQIRDQQQSRSPQPQRPVQQPQQQQAGSDPFSAGPPTQASPPTVSQSTVARKPAAKLISLSAQNGVRQTPAPSGAIVPSTPATVTTIPAAEPHSRLEQIDAQFRQMTQHHPTTWNLGALEQAYRVLSQQSLSVAMRGQIDLRFSAIAHYKQIKSEYDDYFRLVSATARKDAELAAVQNSLDPRDARPAIMPPEQAGPSLDAGPTGSPNSSGPAIPVPTVNTPSPPAPQETASPNVPEFNPQPRQPSTPSAQSHPAGPVLENPVPLPTEPQPELSPQTTPQPAPNPETATQQQPIPQPAIQQAPTPQSMVQQQPIPQPPIQQMPSRQPVFQPQPSRQLMIQSQPGSQPMMQPQPAVVPRSAGAPLPGVYPSSELPTQESMSQQAAPMQQPMPQPMQPAPRQFFQSQPQPSPMSGAPINVAPPSPPSQPAPAPLPGPEMTHGSSQPSVAPQMPVSPQIMQAPPAPMTPPMAPPQQIRPQAPGGMDGAGIIQHAATPISGGPRHVLLAPNGRILAYLYPDRGVNLDAYVGRSMGIFGPRAYRPELRNDLIVVRGLVPVRLTP